MRARIAFAALCLLFGGCTTLFSAHTPNTGTATAEQQGTAAAAGDVERNKANAVESATAAAKTGTLSDADVEQIALQLTVYADSNNRVGGSNNRYTQRLQRLTKAHREVDGVAFTYKVYLNPDVNAFAIADGSVRIYSGLMDLMRDDELLAVIAHETGHVKLKHAARRLRSAFAAAGLRKGVPTAKGTENALASADVGVLFEKYIATQYAKNQEQEADSYGLRFLLKNSYNGQGSVNALYKLAKFEEKGGSPDEMRLLTTHPSPRTRAQRLADEYAELKSNPEKVNQPVVAKEEPVPGTQKTGKAAGKKTKAAASSAKAALEVPEEEPVKPMPKPPVKPAERVAEKTVAADPVAADPAKPVANAVSARGWYVQLSAESQSAAAEVKVKILRAEGVSAGTQAAVVNGKTFYRVLAGPYAQGSEAEAAAAKLKADGLAEGDVFTRQVP